MPQMQIAQEAFAPTGGRCDWVYPRQYSLFQGLMIIYFGHEAQLQVQVFQYILRQTPRQYKSDEIRRYDGARMTIPQRFATWPATVASEVEQKGVRHK